MSTSSKKINNSLLSPRDILLKDDIVSALKSDIFELKNMITEMHKENQFLNSEVKRLNDRNIEMFERVESLIEKNNELEQYTRRNSVRFFGLPENMHEKISDIETDFINIVNNLLHVNVSECDIEAIHRVGKSRKSRARGIIVKFVNRKIKDKIMMRKRQLKDTGFSITEDLTKINFEKLMSLRNDPTIEDAWTNNGKIFAIRNGVKVRYNGDMSYEEVPRRRIFHNRPAFASHKPRNVERENNDPCCSKSLVPSQTEEISSLQNDSLRTVSVGSCYSSSELYITTSQRDNAVPKSLTKRKSPLVKNSTKSKVVQNLTSTYDKIQMTSQLDDDKAVSSVSAVKEKEKDDVGVRSTARRAAQRKRY